MSKSKSASALNVTPIHTVAPVTTLHQIQDSSVSYDVIESLRGLLRDAERGALVGFVCGAMYVEPDRHFIHKTTGEAKSKPMNALGMLEVIKASILQQVLGR